MKAKTYLKRHDRQFYPTKMVWIEEHSYPRWGWRTDPNGRRTYMFEIHTIPGHFAKHKIWSEPWSEKGRYYFYPKYRYYRNMHTFAERRDNLAYPEFVRAKRSGANLPNPWDDRPHEMVKSWKDTHKCRKQWMKNL